MTEAALGGRRPGQRQGVLTGTRIADFCWVGVGSIATRFLADFGAEVIKIEDRERIDMVRRFPIYKNQPGIGYGEERADPDPDLAGLHNNYSRNKLGVTINMRTAKGRELAEQLVAASSVVTENFAPGVMERWGLTYERLQELRPDVIFTRMSGFGQSGPNSSYRSYGPIVQAASGLSFISGLPGQTPSGWGLSYMDNQAAYYNSAAVMLAILQRMRTGEGALVDMSAVDIGITLLGPMLLESALNGREFRSDPTFPTGNRLEHPHAAPHGLYRCAGEDRWVAIAVANDDEWSALITAMQSPGLGADERFATQEARFQHQDALDAILGRWTQTQEAHSVMTKLQSVGVPSSAVQTSQDLCERDPQIRFRELFFELDHPRIGTALFEGVPVTFSKSSPDNWRSAPLLGEDNDHVFGTILGLDPDELARLSAEGVI